MPLIGWEILKVRSVAVTGLGSIGLLFCWLLKQRGAGRVVGNRPIGGALPLAERWGVDQTYSPCAALKSCTTPPESLTRWEAPDICIEAVGHQMDTLNDCIELVRKQGTVLAFGVPDHPVYAIEYETFFRKNAHLMAVVTPVWSEYLAKA